MLKENKYHPTVLNNFIRELISKNYIIVALTSKTYNEVKKLYNKNNIKFPLSSENGSSFYIPRSKNNKDLTFKKVINKKAIKSGEILRKLKVLPIRFLRNITIIKDLSPDKQAKITKLKKSELIDFNNRSFSVSIIWNGSNSLLALFRKYLKKLNLQATYGGKMINVSGAHTKLDALIYFKKMYLKKFSIDNCITISIGDSQNDVEILNYTDYSGIVIRKEKSKISLIKNHNVFISKSSAPEGWVELLTKINKEMERKNI